MKFITLILSGLPLFMFFTAMTFFLLAVCLPCENSRDDVNRRYDELVNASSVTSSVASAESRENGLNIIKADEDITQCMTNDTFILRNVKYYRRHVFAPNELSEKFPIVYVKSGDGIEISWDEYIEFDCGENHFVANYECCCPMHGAKRNGNWGISEIGPGMKFDVDRKIKKKNKCIITFIKM